MPRCRKTADVKVPTQADFEAFDGHHCRQIYAGLPKGWTCPGCARSTFEVLRWTVRFPRSPAAYEGWVGGYHHHHDHGFDRAHLVPTIPPPVPRFARIVVCEQCNAADATAKRKLGLRGNFSFAPWEIRKFVTATAHGFHVIDYDVAAELYRQAEAARYARAGPIFFE